MSLLEIRDLTVAYGPVRVLHGVSLTVEAGELAVVLGANGAGKSTLLRAVSRMIPSGGTICFGGVDLCGRSSEWVARRGLAHVPEGRGTFGTLTVDENLRVGGHGRDRQATRRAIAQWYEVFPRLGERAGQLAAGLSGGEQQMLAIARAMVSGPDLVLLDEPSLGLSPMLAAEVFDGLVRRTSEHGTAVLMVEQNARLALALATNAVVLASGRVAVTGSAADLLLDDGVRRAYLGY